MLMLSFEFVNSVEINLIDKLKKKNKLKPLKLIII